MHVPILHGVSLHGAEQCADGPLMQAFVVVLEIEQLSRQMGLSRMSLSDGSESCHWVCLALLAHCRHALYGSKASRLLLCSHH